MMQNGAMELLDRENKGILPTPMRISVRRQETDRLDKARSLVMVGWIVSTATLCQTMSSCLEFVIFSLVNAEFEGENEV